MQDLNCMKLKLLTSLEKRGLLDELKNTRSLKRKEKIAWQLLKYPIGSYSILKPQKPGEVRLEGDSNG